MRASSVRATADAVISGDEFDQDLDASLDQWVREPSNVRDAGSVPHQAVEGPAHSSNRLVAQLNATWRVVADPLQWRLQRKKGNPRIRNSGWRDRSFCTTRDGLLRYVREYCGDVEPAALAKLTTLPEHYAMQNLDVRGTDQAHANGQSKPLVSQALEDCEPGDQPPRNSQPALS